MITASSVNVQLGAWLLLQTDFNNCKLFLKDVMSEFKLRKQTNKKYIYRKYRQCINSICRAYQYYSRRQHAHHLLSLSCDSGNLIPQRSNSKEENSQFPHTQHLCIDLLNGQCFSHRDVSQCFTRHFCSSLGLSVFPALHFTKESR